MFQSDREFLGVITQQITNFFDKNHWTYDKKEISPTTTIFELSFMIEGHTIKMSAQIDVKRRACILVGYLPICADPVYSYPLCQLIAKENAKKLFGAIKYDERDGEVTYDYAYSVANGIDEEEFEKLFHIVLKMVLDECEILKHYCNGRLNKQETNEVIDKIQKLVNDIMR